MFAPLPGSLLLVPPHSHKIQLEGKNPTFAGNRKGGIFIHIGTIWCSKKSPGAESQVQGIAEEIIIIRT